MSGSSPNISVVMAIGAVDDHLRLQLDSLSAQTFRGPWELVLSLNVADPGQQRGLEDLVKTVEGPRVTLVDSSSMASAAHARNVGAETASADRLAFCDSDDLTDRDWLVAVNRGLENNGALGGQLDETLLAVEGQQGWRPPATPGDLPRFLGHPYLVSANMGVHKQHFEAVGGFDTTMVRGEDIAFSWALLDRGVDLVYWPDAVVHYRHRRGLWPMMRQHYLYGRGFSQLLARRSVPGANKPMGRVASLKPNGQPVQRRAVPYYLRRTSIATGRVVGLLAEARTPLDSRR